MNWCWSTAEWKSRIVPLAAMPRGQTASVPKPLLGFSFIPALHFSKNSTSKLIRSRGQAMDHLKNCLNRFNNLGFSKCRKVGTCPALSALCTAFVTGKEESSRDREARACSCLQLQAGAERRSSSFRQVNCSACYERRRKTDQS
jgi:hypothetical protein